MKSFLSFLLILYCAQALARSSDIPSPPLTDAKAYMVVDLNSSQTILSKNADSRIEPGSLAKLMTAYIVFGALKQKTLKTEQLIPVSEHAVGVKGSRMFLEHEKPATVNELVRGMVIQSANDACIALAEGLAGSEAAFVKKMNEEAQHLGMKNTHYANATGIPDSDQYTTVQDLSILSAAIIRNYPEYYSLFSSKEYTYNNITQPNRNRLLWMDPHSDGIAIGHTESSGYMLASSVLRGKRRLVSVLSGAHSDAGRAIESLKLLNYVLQYYDSVKLYSRGQAVTTLRVWKGRQNTLKAGFGQDLYVTVPRGEESGLKAVIEASQPLVVPVLAGQQVGVVKISLDGKRFAEYPLISLENVSPANFIGRAWDGIKLLFN
ncbi:MAG TPA: D-alanyl-D-alanine carboxypeptidase family protein [Burkholderiales bacterium]|nr:D-alanyl-D-alanine carboxypeptidase family protein [Burkholderiales bacterium]